MPANELVPPPRAAILDHRQRVPSVASGLQADRANGRDVALARRNAAAPSTLPSRLPRALAAARAGLVRALIQSHGTNGTYRCLSDKANMLSKLRMNERWHMKTATDRAAEAIEAAEVMFASEMGATLNLTPAAKEALIWSIAAAIEKTITEERARLVCVH